MVIEVQNQSIRKFSRSELDRLPGEQAGFSKLWGPCAEWKSLSCARIINNNLFEF